MAPQFAYYEDTTADYDVDFRSAETPLSRRLFNEARGEVSSRQKHFNRARYSQAGGTGINGIHRRGAKRKAS